MAAVLAVLSRGDRRIVISDALQGCFVMAHGGGLDDLEVSGNKARMPFVFVAHCPDDPDFIGAASNRFIDVGVRQIHGVDIGLVIDANWGRSEEHTSELPSPCKLV